MKISDIPQYIDTGSWECNYSFEKLVKAIEDWSNGIDTNVKLEMNSDWKHSDRSYKEKHSDRSYKDFVCVDGLQRYTAIKKFINNEIKIFGYYYNEYEDDLRMKYDIKINVNDLPTRKDVLQWYVEMNSNGTINRVKMLIEKEI